ncbi:hypothetical protein CTAYLR_004310 [Chrysophaeum taylorii]|uniref:HMA domain-containing protein n=1 Tax=Chrysophaeum taylorii TaxID=2483200 RepID=A0AAD7UGF8_9STRA|nr:hypothetical protein CTAYLR_004310 [Chrysophaeum taylorii]
MTCAHCVETVRSAIEGVEGVTEARVELPGSARVEGGSAEEIEAAVSAVGFEAAEENKMQFLEMEEEEQVVVVKGMACAQCEAWVSAALRSVEGVTGLTVSREEGVARVRGRAVARDLERAVREAGYYASDSPPPASGNDDERRVSIRVTGMTCGACASRVSNELSRIGARRVAVNPLTDTATLVAARDISDEALGAAVEKAGYGVGGISREGSRVEVARFVAKGMTCPSCPPRIERVLLAKPGVESVAVSYMLEVVEVEFDSRHTSAREVAAVLAGLGYEPKEEVPAPREEEEEEEEDKARKLARTDEVFELRRLALMALVLAVPTAAISMALPRFSLIWKKKQTLDYAAWATATPVQFWFGRRFYSGAFHALRFGSANMDVLVALGSSAAYFYSSLATISPSLGTPRFDTSAMLVAFVLLGKWLEARAKGRTSFALQELLKLQPAEAVVPDAEGGDVVVPASSLRRGDLVRVKPGARVPADATVIRGESTVDESMLTGESVPVPKIQDSQIYGGTLNAGPGLLAARVDAVGKDAMLSGIVSLVERAQGSKTKIEALADVVARHFVVGVVLISLATFFLWLLFAPSSWTRGEDEEGDDDRFLLSFLFAISVLVVACPCALGLATPAAVMVGTGLGAKHGVLIKGGRPLEIAHRVNAVVFDKTGTLTRGSPRISAVLVFEEAPLWKSLPPTRDNALALVAAAEQGSEHPLALAITREVLSSEDWRVDRFEAAVGRGVEADVANKSIALTVRVGTRDFLAAAGHHLSPHRETEIAALEAAGNTVLLFGAMDGVSACVAVSDAPRPEARAAVASLRRRGVEVWMLTGDNDTVARAVAASVGIDMIVARAGPADKAAKLAEIKARGRVVAMVGDGLNDGPALASADLGVAMGKGTQLAVEAADVVLIRSRLDDVLVALDVSRATFSRIRANLAFSLAFNAIAIPVAAGALYPCAGIRLPPELAALAMVCSSVSVLLSSLSLAAYDPHKKKDYIDFFGADSSSPSFTAARLQRMPALRSNNRRLRSTPRPLRDDDDLALPLISAPKPPPPPTRAAAEFPAADFV